MLVPRSRLILVGFGLVLGLAVLGIAIALRGGDERPRYYVEGELRPGGYFRRDPDLGYAPALGVRVRAQRFHRGRPVYDVHYTIDDHGLRRSGGDTTGPAVLFFGGSFTFGEGVEDEETLPAVLAEALTGKARVLNAGFHGYGPHQMLRALELGRYDPLAPDGVVHVVYQGLSGHVGRVAGRATWDIGGPRYEVVGGDVRYTGPFRPWLSARFASVLNRFGPTRDLRASWLRAGPDDVERDRALFVEVVVRSAEIVRERWGAAFTVVYWDEPGADLAERLRARGVAVIEVSDLLGGRARVPYLLPMDLHPNAKGHRAIGEALLPHLRLDAND